jgi:hypothetical protein
MRHPRNEEEWNEAFLDLECDCGDPVCGAVGDECCGAAVQQPVRQVRWGWGLLGLSVFLGWLILGWVLFGWWVLVWSLVGHVLGRFFERRIGRR